VGIGIEQRDDAKVVLITIVGMAACYFPARRAMRLDPVVALRGE
jgi:ABC-type antimicrobial peptide transport system permease subunit